MSYSYDNLRLGKDMYSDASISFSQVLERLDPSENYRGTSLEGLDAYQRQLKRFDIKVKGVGSDVVEKFFRTSGSTVLFPEYIARAVRQGMEESNILPSITATVTKVNGMDYRSIKTESVKSKKELMDTHEGTDIPHSEVQIKENMVKLHKRGRMLVASYEAIRYQKLDLFSVTLRQIGAYMNRMHLEDAINVLENGDGNDNSARVFQVGVSPIGGASEEIAYDDLVDFWAQFDPYEMNTLLVSSDVMLKMLKMEELHYPISDIGFYGTGSLPTPLGAKLLRVSAMERGKLVGLDNRYALEMVQCGDIVVDYDRLIDRQFERSAIANIAGFSKVFKDASKVLKL